MKSIIDTYNGGQKNWKIKDMYFGQDVYYQQLKNDKIPKNHKMLLDHTSCGIYEFINNPKYAVIETLEKDKETRDDFLIKSRDGYNKINYIKETKKYFMNYYTGTHEMTKQMLAKYWELYILQRIKQENK